jgi:cytochrome P450
MTNGMARVGRADWEQHANARTGAGAVFDPFPTLATLRRESPVLADSLPAILGVEDPLADVFGDRPQFWTLTYAATAEVLADPARFGNHGLKPMSERNYGKVSLQASDGPEHRRFRQALQPAFNRRGLDLWLRWLPDRLDELIDRIEARGRANLYFDYCAEFPSYVTARGFGVRAADTSLFAQWGALLQTAATDPDQLETVTASVTDYLAALIDESRLHPAANIVSLLVGPTAQAGAQPLPDEEVLGLLRNLMPAGVGTTYRTLGIVLLALLERPPLLERVASNPDLVRPAIEEGLRWDPPVAWVPRVAVHDCELAGLEIPEGAVVYACLAAANRDPAVFADPDEFDIDRSSRLHLSFSAGTHFCIGAQLGRLELEMALARLLERLPALRLDPAEPRPAVTGFLFRMPTAVPALWQTREDTHGNP